MPHWNSSFVIAALGLIGHIVLLAVLIGRRHYRLFPIFTLSIFWFTVTDPILVWVRNSFPQHYLAAYTLELVVESVVSLAVLFELGRRVLAPMQGKTVRAVRAAALATASLLTIVVFALTWHAVKTIASGGAVLSLTLSLGFDILRVTLFITLVLGSRLLGINWRSRALQIASGLAFYSIFSMAVQLLRSHLELGPAHTSLSILERVAYLITLTYWCTCLGRQMAVYKEVNAQASFVIPQLSTYAKENHAFFHQPDTLPSNRPNE